MSATTPDIDKMPFEEALAELERVVRALEEGEGGLQQAVDLYERGAKLRKRCEDELRAAQARIEAVAADADGQATGTQPLDPE